MADQKNEILHEPPILFPLVDDQKFGLPSNKISDFWQRFFTNLHKSFKQFFPVITGQDSNGTYQYSVPLAPSFTTEERDNLQNVNNGSFIYNTTTNKFNFRENGNWKEIT